MSQKTIELVNSEGKTADEVEREALRDFESSQNQFNGYLDNDINKNLDKSVDNVKKTGNEVADSIGTSNGYKPSTTVSTSTPSKSVSSESSRASSLPRSQEPLPNNNASSFDRKETAPDLGKNYGDSLPEPGSNGYQQYRDVPNSESGEAFDREVTPGQQVDAQQNLQQSGKNNELDNGENTVEYLEWLTNFEANLASKVDTDVYGPKVQAAKDAIYAGHSGLELAGLKIAVEAVLTTVPRRRQTQNILSGYRTSMQKIL